MDVSVTGRADVQEILLRLAAPLAGCTSPGGARVSVATAVNPDIPAVVSELEGFARPLWGLAPLAAGGDARFDFSTIRNGLANGTDPGHPEFWGQPADFDQRLVEIAAIAFALCLAPAVFQEPLSGAARKRVVEYLDSINRCKLYENNWLWFRVLANLALDRLGQGADRQRLSADLVRLDSYYLGDGWYSDGPRDRQDYYVAFGMHFYALIYSVLARESDAQRCDRYRERAAAFAADFIHWFGADGSAVPYGRSLSYRFAQGAFWGALAFADVEVLPWGVVKGLALRNLRWWLRRPIFTEDGLLTAGYGYANPRAVEVYISPGSSYWAFKWFLPLALPASHPFWSAAEEPLPPLAEVSVQRHPKLLLCRNARTDHVVALACGQRAEMKLRHAAALYSKFCYSNRFAFSVRAPGHGLEAAAFDNVLALRKDGARYAVRARGKLVELTGAMLVCDWRVLGDVQVRTWLVPAGEWHVRIHRVRSRHDLVSAEGGFALGVEEPGSANLRQHTDAGIGFAGHADSTSLVCDLYGRRSARIVRAAPDTNLLHRQTVIPMLEGRHAAGEFWLACAVLGQPAPVALEEARLHTFVFEPSPAGFKLMRGGSILLSAG